MTKREISAHKGGRTVCHRRARATPAERAAVDAELKRLDLSMSDWLWIITAYSGRITKAQAHEWLEESGKS